MKIESMGEIFGGKATGVKYEEPSLNEYTTKGKLPELKLDKTDFLTGKVKGLDNTDLMKKLKPKKQTSYANVFSKKGLPSMKMPKNNSINGKLPKNFTSPKFNSTLPKRFNTTSLPKGFSGYNSTNKMMKMSMPKATYRAPKLKSYTGNFSLKSSGKGFEKMLFGASVGRPERIAKKRMRQQKGLPMYGDFDKDGVANILDCDPLDKFKQDNFENNQEQFLATPEQLEELERREKQVGRTEPVLEVFDVEEDDEMSERENVTPFSTKTEDEFLRDPLTVIEAETVDKEEPEETLKDKTIKQAKKVGTAVVGAGKSAVERATRPKAPPTKEQIQAARLKLEGLKLTEARTAREAKILAAEKKKFGFDKPTDFQALTGTGLGGPIKQDFSQLTGTGLGNTGTQDFAQLSGTTGTGIGIQQSVAPASGIGAAQSLGTVGTGVGFAQTLGIQQDLQQQIQNPTYIGQPQPVVQQQVIQTPQQPVARPLPDSPDIPGQDYIPRGDGTYFSRRSGRVVRYPRGKYRTRQQFQQ